MVECNLNKLGILTQTHWRTAPRGPTRTRRDANEAQRRDNDGRVRSDETPHGIDGGGVPLTRGGVTRPRIVAARRPPRSVYSSGFRKRMASPRHDRSSVTNPSRASSNCKSDDRAPAVRGAAHRAPSRISDVPKSSRSPRAGGKAPPRVTSVREGALRRPRRPQKERAAHARRVEHRRA